jgi:hypothetical protein
MPFTTGTLATFIVTTLGPTGVALGLTVASAGVVDAVAEVEAVLDSPTADLTDDLKTRIVTRWIAWRTALGAATGDRDLKAGTSAITMSQRFKHILLMLRDAENAASAYSEVQAVLAGGNVATVSEMATSGSPYAYPTYPEF